MELHVKRMGYHHNGFCANCRYDEDEEPIKHSLYRCPGSKFCRHKFLWKHLVVKVHNKLSSLFINDLTFKENKQLTLAKEKMAEG